MENLLPGMENDAASRIAGLLFASHDDAPDQPGVHPMTVRMPATTAAYVAEMAETAGISRNAMACLLLKAGIAESLSRLPVGVGAEIASAADDRVDEFI